MWGGGDKRKIACWRLTIVRMEEYEYKRNSSPRMNYQAISCACSATQRNAIELILSGITKWRENFSTIKEGKKSHFASRRSAIISPELVIIVHFPIRRTHLIDDEWANNCSLKWGEGGAGRGKKRVLKDWDVWQWHIGGGSASPCVIVSRDKWANVYHPLQGFSFTNEKSDHNYFRLSVSGRCLPRPRERRENGNSLSLPWQQRISTFLFLSLCIWHTRIFPYDTSSTGFAKTLSSHRVIFLFLCLYHEILKYLSLSLSLPLGFSKAAWSFNYVRIPDIFVIFGPVYQSTMTLFRNYENLTNNIPCYVTYQRSA